MQWPEKDSPFWKLCTGGLLASVLFAMLAFSYANGYDMTKDTSTIVAALLAYLGGDVLRSRFGSD